MCEMDNPGGEGREKGIKTDGGTIKWNKRNGGRGMAYDEGRTGPGLPHHVVLEQMLGVVDTSCAKLSLLMRIAMGITWEDYESKSLRYKIYLRSVEALEKGEY